MNSLLDSITGLADHLSLHISISILGKPYSIQSNAKQAIRYVEELFFSSHVNGIVYEKNTLPRGAAIQHVSIEEADFDTLLNSIREAAFAKERCQPVNNSYYDVYKLPEACIYFQDYTDDTSGKHLILNRSGNYILITVPNPYEFMILARFVREIAFRLLQDDGYFMVHTSAVQINGKGILIVGNSGAGKTTLALSLCKFNQAKFVTNDRLLIKFDEHMRPQGVPFGMPIKMNYGTLRTLQVETQYEQWQLSIPMVSKKSFYEFKGEHKLHISPRELNTNLGIGLQGRIQIEGIVIPRILRANMQELEQCDIRRTLEDNCYFDQDPVFVEDWLGIRNTESTLDQSTKQSMLEQLLQLPVLDITFPVDQFKNVAMDITRWVDSW